MFMSRIKTLSARDWYWLNPRKKNYREHSNIKCLYQSIDWLSQPQCMKNGCSTAALSKNWTHVAQCFAICLNHEQYLHLYTTTNTSFVISCNLEPSFACRIVVLGLLRNMKARHSQNSWTQTSFIYVWSRKSFLFLMLYSMRHTRSKITIPAICRWSLQFLRGCFPSA